MSATTASVFSFTVYDIDTDAQMLSSRKGTREAIAAVGGVALEETVEVVDFKRLDGNGFVTEI